MRGLPISWGPILATVYHQDFCGVFTWCPSSRFIAVTKSATIDILDATTLDPLATLYPPQNTPQQQIWFSPHDYTLSQFHQGKLTRWDLQTGVPVGTASFEGWNECLEDSFSFAYSRDGKILAVSGISPQYPSLINTYNLTSGAQNSFHDPERQIINPIWTDDDCLRFVTLKPEPITMWEASFTSVHTPAMVRSLPTPDEVADIKDQNSLFHPVLSQLAFTARGMVLIWDTQIAGFLLKFRPALTLHTAKVCKMSFSSDGCFFAHTSTNQEVYVWKGAPTQCYVLHQKLRFPPGQIHPLLSPNGKSIVTAVSSTIHLWHTTDQIISSPNLPASEDGGKFVLGFSPDEVLAASASLGGHVVTIFDLQSGDLQLKINVGMGIWCLGMTTNTIIAAGSGGEVVTYNLPARNCNNNKVDIYSNIQTSTPCCSGVVPPSISPDFSHIAIIGYSKVNSEVGVSESFIPCLQIHDMSTGKQLAGVEISHLPKRIALGEHEVWCIDQRGFVEGWNIVEDSRSGIARLESLETTTCSLQVFPWQSQYGYEVVDNWIISPSQKRLLWLPHYWRPQEDSRTWNRRFLGLGCGGLLEAVILEVLL